MPNSWEVWWAIVKFEDSDETEQRPIIVLDNTTAYIVSLKVTSHAPRRKMVGEYEIVRWQEAGLTKPSTVKTLTPSNLTNADFRSKIGELDVIDIFGIQQMIDFYRS